MKSPEYEYVRYIQADAWLKIFSEHLNRFVAIFQRDSDPAPVRVEYSIFHHPEAELLSPLVDFYYPNTDEFNVVEVIEAFSEKLKQYLADVSTTMDEFKQYRKIERLFKFNFTRA